MKMSYWHVDEEAEPTGGIPTTFTPVPSDDEQLLAEQRARRPLLRRRRAPGSASNSFSSLVAVENDVEMMMMSSTVMVKVHFMQNLLTSFELATDGAIRVLLRHVVRNIAKEIRNQFSFYVYASPYDVIWRRPRCELMRKPPRTNLFRHMITPAQATMTLSELASEMKAEGVDTLNFYIFVKNMEDKSEPSETTRSWKIQQIID